MWSRAPARRRRNPLDGRTRGLRSEGRVTIVAGLSPRALGRQAELNAEALKLAPLYNAGSVGDAIASFRPPVETAKALAVVQHLLLWGLLENAN